MENVNVNEQRPSYNELAAAYQNLLQQAQDLERRYQALLQDKALEKISTVGKIIENKDAYSNKIVKLAEWHLAQVLAKPKA